MVASSLALFTLGCGGASQASSQTYAAQKAPTPFGSAGDISELRASDDLAEGDSGAQVKIDPKDLQIPGAKYGKKRPPVEKGNCPKGKKGKKCRKALKKGSRIPVSAEIADQMKGLPWGMHVRAVAAQFESTIRRSYKETLAAAKGAIEEDRARSKMMREIDDLKKSYVKFDGQRTGFEGTMIENEFTHNNNESLFYWDAGKYVEYMFFFNERFWKRVRTFRRDSFKADISFDDYVATLTNRFGRGLEMFGESGELIEIKWQNNDTYMSARDQSGFYGVFVLVFAARVTEDNLAKLRPNKGRRSHVPGSQTNSLVEAVTSGDAADHNSSVIDSYTGGGAAKKSSTTTGPSPDTTAPNADTGGQADEPAPAPEPPAKDTSIDDLF